MIDKQMKEEKLNLRQTIKLAEDARAAEIRAKKSHKASLPLGKVIEVDLEDGAENKKQVRFADSGVDRNYTVRSIVKPVEDRIGVEAAIREEMDHRKRSVEQRNVIRQRNIAASKRAQMQRQRITASYFEDIDTVTPVNPARLLPTDTSRTKAIDDVDRVQPKASVVTEVGHDSSDTSTASLHASVMRLDPQRQPVKLSLEGVVIGEATRGSKPQTSAAPASSEPSKTKHDDDFIAKVLQGFEMLQDPLDVNVMVEEVSTLQSSSTTEATAVSSSRSIGSSLSSADITQERFLSAAWKNENIRSLIDLMRTKKEDKQTWLRGYIEKLLQMKREEIADLSLTDTTVSTFSRATSLNLGSGFVSSTPASILTTTSGSSSGGGSSEGSKMNKSVRFRDDQVDGSFLSRNQDSKVHTTLISPF